MITDNELMKRNARKSRVVAVAFTVVFHLALFGSIAYFSSPEDSAFRTKIKALFGQEDTNLKDITMQP